MCRMFTKFILILVVLAIVESAKILVVVPTPALSHQLVFRQLIQELINHGHQVTAITTQPVYPQGGSPNNLREINLYELTNKMQLTMVDTKKFFQYDNLSVIKYGQIHYMKIFMEILKEKSVFKLFRDTTVMFDLLILQSFLPATLIFSHVFKAPVIFMSTLGAMPGNMKTMGSEEHSLLYPKHYLEKIYNLTIWDKICQWYYDAAYDKLFKELEMENDERFKYIFGIDTPALNKFKNNIHMLFLNVHPIWLHNQPVPPNVVYTWGIHKPMEKTLPKELQTYLDLSSQGAIYISFGSIFKTQNMAQETLEIFIKVLSTLPYNVLWKWDADELPGKSENIKISKWFPQCDILRHPNLKFFITHGGLQSTDEAINAGVPVIGIPQFADQAYNTEKYVHFKIGMKLDYKSLTIENFENAIKTLLTNYNSYKENIVRLRTKMQDQPKPALEHVMWRIDYILRHGGVQHLRAPAANMSWVEYYELETISLLLCGIIALVSALIVILHYFISKVLRYTNTKIKQS